MKKPMKDCTGEELLTEYLHHLHLDEEKIQELMATVVNVIPCYMPYVDAQFQPRKMTDRPEVIPQGSTNFAMISQFVEIPEDMVFTEEYSVRAARLAVYGPDGCGQGSLSGDALRQGPEDFDEGSADGLPLKAAGNKRDGTNKKPGCQASASTRAFWRLFFVTVDITCNAEALDNLFHTLHLFR